MAGYAKSLIEKWAALYVRLSRDDDNDGDSNSISHQVEILTKYAKEHGIENFKIYKDDGFSGTNFNRPGFQEMMGDIENGLVSMVVVKDMSRFGRNYLEVGMYTEIRFPEMGVRFIAVNDGVDSEREDNDFTPFRNIINEWYGKRCGFSKRYFLVLVACRHLTCTKTECRKMFLSLIAPLTTIRLNRGKRSNRLPYIFAQGQER